MKANKSNQDITHYEWADEMNAEQIREAAEKCIKAGYFDEFFTVGNAPVEYLRGMLEDAIFENGLTKEDL